MALVERTPQPSLFGANETLELEILRQETNEPTESVSPSGVSPGKLAALRELLPSALQRQLKSGRELLSDAERGDEPWMEDGRLPTGVSALDELLDGGLRAGETLEVIGARTSGRFSLVLETLASTTASGQVAALVDLGDNFDPATALDVGIELERLLWLRPRHMKKALASAEILIGAGFPLVILDLGTPPVAGGRGKEAAWLRLARAADEHRTRLLVSAPYRMSGSAAHAVLKLERRPRVRWAGRAYGRPTPAPAPNLLLGLVNRLLFEKARGALARRARRKTTIELSWQMASESLAEPLVETLEHSRQAKSRPTPRAAPDVAIANDLDSPKAPVRHASGKR